MEYEGITLNLLHVHRVKNISLTVTQHM